MNHLSYTIEIELRHVTKVYGTGPFGRSHIRALADISIEIRRGELFALIGPNGAGKSTCMKIIAGTVHPTSGRIRVMNKSLNDLSVRGQIGYLPEQIPIPMHMTPQNFLYLMGRLCGMEKNMLSRRIGEVTELLHIDSWKNIPMKKFSRGMIQKIGLAQAVLHKPRILLLDEPSEGLDPGGRKDLRDFLSAYRSGGSTVLISSHLLSELELLADRVAVLNKGMNIKTGPVAEFTDAEKCIEIKVNGHVPKSIENELQSWSLTTDGDTTIIGIPASVHPGQVLELLASAGITPVSINRMKRSLEDAFINLIEGKSNR